MTREELVARIKKHESMCRTPEAYFAVAEVAELADGVLAVRETDGERTIYADKSKWKINDEGAFTDVSPMIPRFPADTMFVTDIMARTWEDISTTAKLSLKKVGRGKHKWHKKPVNISY